MGDIMMEETIDFADIANQIYRREMNRVYEFNLMLVGLTGFGKSTLVKSLFQGMIKPKGSEEQKLNEYTELLVENGVKLRLRCIETSRYFQHQPDEYVKYIDEQFKSYFVATRRVSSWNIKDTRVHCCLYLIFPHDTMRLRQEDIECMKALQDKVNLVPVIVKSDIFNPIQLAKLKENILTDLEFNDIKYFKFQYDIKEDEDRYECVKSEAKHFPFAVVAADEPLLIDNKERWIRETMGSKIDILDSTKSDFNALAQLLIRHCMLNLIDETHIKYYGRFKAELLRVTRTQEGRNLKGLGLKPNEIKHIVYALKKIDMEKELQELRDRKKGARAQCAGI